MKFMIALLMAVLPALSFPQSQLEAGQGLPGGAIPKTTAVLVIQTPKQGVTVQQVMAVIPDEIQATVRLYLDGKIREWYSRGDGKGVILLVDAKTEDEARALMETLPLAKPHLRDNQYIPVGPRSRRRIVTPAAFQGPLGMAPMQDEPALEGDYHDQAQNHRDWRDREDRKRCPSRIAETW